MQLQKGRLQKKNIKAKMKKTIKEGITASHSGFLIRLLLGLIELRLGLGLESVG